MQITNSFETFSQASYADIQNLVPQTIITAFGGTRRSAVLAGLEPRSKEAMIWQRQQMVTCFQLIFRHGVKNIITSVAIDRHLLESDMTRRKVLDNIAWGMASQEIINEYKQLGWRVRIIGIDSLPELANAANTLIQELDQIDAPTVWYWICSDLEEPLNNILEQIHYLGVTNKQELISKLYGEDIPPATLLLGTGEPQFHYGLLPPLLMERLEGYWIQRPGYALTEDLLRRILFDYIYTRQTGSGSERNDRYESIVEQRQAWLTDWIIGVGCNIGGFWYPNKFNGLET